MGKQKVEHEKEIANIIKEKKIMFISHIFGHYTDLKSSQFYNLGLEKSEIIKSAIAENRKKATSFMLNKWIASDNATLQIAAYKLLCDDEERMNLTQEHVSVDAKIDNIKELNAAEAVELLQKIQKEV